MEIRDADPDRDGAACSAIYAPFVLDTAVSFEEVPPPPEEFAKRIRETSRSHPGWSPRTAGR
jgi:L-amino acid N-acyltransferase YncA